MNKKPAARPSVQLRPGFLRALEAALGEHSGVKAAISGIYEGRQLDGAYKLVIDGARMVPVDLPETPQT